MISLRSAALISACSVALVACGGGSGTGGDIGVATSFNVLTHAAGSRDPAPAVEGERLADGPAITAADTAGAPVVVNFWGSWCGPCRAEQPKLEALWERYRARGVHFVGVNTRRDQRAAALAFLDEFDVTYPSIYDPDSRLAAAFGVLFMPSTVVVDADGNIAAQVIGAIRSEADLAAILDAEVPTT